MNRAEYRQVALARLTDARTLLRARRYDGAYYLAGYVVECALKACIARQFRVATIPDPRLVSEIYRRGHELPALARLAGLEFAITAEARRDGQFGSSWVTVQRWTADSRYEVGRARVQAQNLYDSVADPSHGVLRWLKQHW